jgi:hypothetical protein
MRTSIGPRLNKIVLRFSLRNMEISEYVRAAETALSGKIFMLILIFFDIFKGSLR